ncbi:MAG: ribosome-associated protein [Cognaticolwellia sp.]|jgi:ribosome-associated protein|tara:strand:+ start:18 stop:242 length:225 start_codon:yes stop_codon:yes gene_type:complete
MQNDTFSLRPADEFIELVKLLKITQIAQTGGHAKIIIENEEIVVNGEVELRKRKKLRVGDIVAFEGIRIEIVKE